MSTKNSNLFLEKDEIDLLSEIMLTHDDDNTKELDFSLHSSAKGETLLSQLGQANTLQLSAQYDNHHIVFPVHIHTGDFSELKMTLRAPEIFETGKTRRAWRLTTNDKKAYLVNKHGEQQRFQIEDLSATGISFLVDPNIQSEFPEVLDDVFIQLPNGKQLAISGLQISRVDERVVAYSISERIDKSALDSLYEYLFECHAEEFPEAHINMPV
ncbi:hypothetical protein ACR30L_13200 [Psychromonas sp. PT13]|uniref:hypothetical protein n=1 Tax=Psychromonas sp. PT13 TaxID=3439547 RepID=UPI003EC02848